MTDRRECRAHLLVWVAAICFAAIVFTWSAWRWWTFRYGTFDLAFYVQSLWLALHGQWQVSLLEVPLLGNHAEPVVFLALPAFALCPHPLLLVALQTLALASLPLTAWRIVKYLEFSAAEALAFALSVALLPATMFIGLHEFHPEALAAPILLLMAEARLTEKRGRFWLWWLLAVGTKENVALLLVAWSVVHTFCERKKPWAHQWRWNVLPGLTAVFWLALYGAWISPRLNGGKVDYLELYSHLGQSGGEIIRGAFSHPEKIFGALGHSLRSGDLLWGMLLPFLALPLLRPRYLLIAAPVLLQHLLSWRSSEWTIHFHYAAPLVPLFWLGAAEASRPMRHRRLVAWSIVLGCLLAQLWSGTVSELMDEIREVKRYAAEREWKAQQLVQVQADRTASVLAGNPYLSHLAMRPSLYSLHHVLKGLQTLSRRRYVPPPATDYVLIDAGDDSTFSKASGFFHPAMRTVNGEIVPSSEALLHEFLAPAEWETRTVNSLSVLHRVGSPERDSRSAVQKKSEEPLKLIAADAHATASGLNLEISTRWELAVPRKKFRWLKLLASSEAGGAFEIVRGIIAPEVSGPTAEEHWSVHLPPELAPGEYKLRLVVFDQLAILWGTAQGSGPLAGVSEVHPLGQVHLGEPGFTR